MKHWLTKMSGTNPSNNPVTKEETTHSNFAISEPSARNQQNLCHIFTELCFFFKKIQYDIKPYRQTTTRKYNYRQANIIRVIESLYKQVQRSK